MSTETIIIPIAGGKGGTGKSLFTANLGIALAAMGHATVLVDLDMGGSNLYSFLGMANKFPGIGDFLKFGNAELHEHIIDTEFTNLKYLPGDGRSPFMANITYPQKRKLIHALKKISTEYLLLDLGAGSSYNTMDFFGISKRGIVLTTPDQPAFMNMLVFLKNFIFRRIDRSLLRHVEARQLLHELNSQPITLKPVTMQLLYNELNAIDKEAGAIVDNISRIYCPRLIVNRGRQPDQLNTLKIVSDTIEEMLSLHTEHFGFIFEDPNVWKSLEKGVPLLQFAPEGIAAQGIATIAGRIHQFWQRKLENSAERLFKNTQKFYDAFRQ